MALVRVQLSDPDIRWSCGCTGRDSTCGDAEADGVSGSPPLSRAPVDRYSLGMRGVEFAPSSGVSPVRAYQVGRLCIRILPAEYKAYLGTIRAFGPLASVCG